MKKLLKSEIRGGKQYIGPTFGWKWVEKSNFSTKKKKNERGRNTSVHLGSTKRASQTHPKTRICAKRETQTSLLKMCL